MAAVATRASATITLVSIFLLGASLHLEGKASVGEIVTFMNFATLLIGKLEHVVSFVNWVLLILPKLNEFFDVLDTKPTVHDRPDAIDAGRLTGRVAFEDVSFTYDGRRMAVEHASFTVEPGQTVALVGSTGSGKSTTLGLLHRVFDPQSGAITIDGKDIRDMTLLSLRRNIGVVFQEPMLFRGSVRHNVELPLLYSGAKLKAAERRRRAMESLEAVGLGTRFDHHPNQLSGGQQQRVAIARALITRPSILLADEPTGNLDTRTSIEVMGIFQRLNRERGITVLVTTHYLDEAEHCHRIAIIHAGKLAALGSTTELKQVFAGRAIFEVQHSLEDVQAARYPERVLLCDRGTVDGAAYWPDGAAEFFATMNSTYEAELARYDVVLFFETSAVGGIRFEGGNRYRTESNEQAIALDSRLRKLWSPHPRFHLVPHSTSFLRKITVGLAILESVVAELHSGWRPATLES